MSGKIELISAVLPEDVEQVRALFLEYAQSLSFSLCFQSFDEELRTLPGDYSPPHGRLLLARGSHEAAGCVALHKFEDGVCEMKRLYVRPGFRGMGIGSSLVDRVVADARRVGYQRMRLDTIASSMQDAIALYRRKGFQEIAPYRVNPIEGAWYMELVL
jgi:putative acetyltransferase